MGRSLPNKNAETCTTKVTLSQSSNTYGKVGVQFHVLVSSISRRDVEHRGISFLRNVVVFLTAWLLLSDYGKLNKLQLSELFQL